MSGLLGLYERKSRAKVGYRNGSIGTKDVAVVGLGLVHHLFEEASARFRIYDKVEVRPDRKTKPLEKYRSPGCQIRHESVRLTRNKV